MGHIFLSVRKGVLLMRETTVLILVFECSDELKLET